MVLVSYRCIVANWSPNNFRPICLAGDHLSPTGRQLMIGFNVFQSQSGRGAIAEYKIEIFSFRDRRSFATKSVAIFATVSVYEQY